MKLGFAIWDKSKRIVVEAAELRRFVLNFIDLILQIIFIDIDFWIIVQSTPSILLNGI